MIRLKKKKTHPNSKAIIREQVHLGLQFQRESTSPREKQQEAGRLHLHPKTQRVNWKGSEATKPKGRPTDALPWASLCLKSMSLSGTVLIQATTLCNQCPQSWSGVGVTVSFTAKGNITT